MAACYKCQKPIVQALEGPLPADAVCEQCSSWLHCCANCTHYDEFAANQCQEPRAPYEHDRLGKNNCSFFRLKSVMRQVDRPVSPKREQRERESRARENLNRLFKF